jgi:hypothetical protein
MRTHWTLFAGVAALLFSGFQAFHHVRSHAEADEVNLPFDVILATCVGVLATLFGALNSIAAFKPSKGVRSLNAVKHDDFMDRPSFRRYFHRGKELRLRANKAF